MTIMEVDGKDDENLSSFKRNLRKMILLEEEAKKRREAQRSRKLVSIRVGKIEGMAEEPERKFVKDRRRVFEESKPDYEQEGRVRERIESLDKREAAPGSDGILGKKDANRFVCGGDEIASGEEKGLESSGIEGRAEGGESSKIVEECKTSVGKDLCEHGPKYKDEGVDDECFGEISVEDIKKSLLAELDEEKESGVDIVSAVIKSEGLAVSEQEVVYVDAESNSSEAERSPYSISCNVYTYDTHYKISDLSKGDLSGCVPPSEGDACFLVKPTDGESAKEQGGGGHCEPGSVAYRDPEEEKDGKGWFSRMFESIFFICCGKPE